jgi:hypothetical protein
MLATRDTTNNELRVGVVAMLLGLLQTAAAEFNSAAMTSPHPSWMMCAVKDTGAVLLEITRLIFLVNFRIKMFLG